MWSAARSHADSICEAKVTVKTWNQIGYNTDEILRKQFWKKDNILTEKTFKMWVKHQWKISSVEQ